MDALKKPLDVIGKEPGVRVCGHADTFKILKNEKPEYAARRKEKWLAKRCAACVEEASRLEKAEAAKRRVPFRLPHGSTFRVVYDDKAEKWTGTLTVGEEALEQSASSVHHLLKALGWQWLKAHPATCRQ